MMVNVDYFQLQRVRLGDILFILSCLQHLLITPSYNAG